MISRLLAVLMLGWTASKGQVFADTTTSELARRLHLTPAAVSQQLGVLRRAGVVDARRQGREVYSELTASGRRLLDLLG